MHRTVLLVALLLAGSGTLTGLVAAGATPWVVHRMDGIWLHWMLQARWPPLVAAAVVLDVVGSVAVMALGWLLACAALAVRRRWRAVAGFAAAVVAAEVCTWALKSVLDRPRPPASLVATGPSSFPSGHTTAATVTGVALVLVLAPRRGGWWLAGAVLFAAAMGWSRTYLGAHWLSDVLAAGFLAAAFAVGMPLLARMPGRGARRRPAGAEGASAEWGQDTSPEGTRPRW